MPPTTAPRVGPAGPPPQAGATTRPPLPLPRRHSPGEPAPAADDPAGRPQHAADTAQHQNGQPFEETGGAWALVKAAQEGDMVAFGDLFDRYYDVVFRYVLFRTGDRTLAEDLTQETFVRALRRISSVSYQGRDIGAWFVTIARNLIFDHVKSSRYRLEQTTSEIIELSPSTGGPEQEVLDGATNDELLRCVRKLNPDQQECIQLRFLQGLSVAETAEIMDRNEGAVKALQHRAVRRLAQLLPEGLR
jgi:RNA polymerase sigma-70 factor, ECF subfamily